MPTTKPRYVITDTGATTEMLDRAQRAWPEISDRKQLLLRLAAAGREAIDAEEQAALGRSRREDQRATLDRTASRLDADVLLGDAAWR